MVLRFNPREGSTFIYHPVAASIPEDRLRTGEVQPRKNLGSYDTELRDLPEKCIFTNNSDQAKKNEMKVVGGCEFELGRRELAKNCGLCLLVFGL